MPFILDVLTMVQHYISRLILQDVNLKQLFGRQEGSVACKMADCNNFQIFTFENPP